MYIAKVGLMWFDFYKIDLWHTLATQIHHDGRYVTIEVVEK